MNQHDASYKAIFTHPQIIQQLLESFVDQDWVQELDFATLEKTNASFVSADCRERFDDVIWKVRWKNQALYIYLLLEFQSTRDHFMAVRIMTYLGLLYQDLIASQKLTAQHKLPPVLPIVLHRGRQPWRCPLDIAELIAKPSATLARYSPQLSYFLIDECQYPSEVLTKIDNALALLFQLEKDDEILTKAKQVMRLFLLVRQSADLERVFRHWVEHTLSCRLEDPQAFKAAQNLEEMAIMLEECVDSWVKQWKHAGLQEGRQEGLQQGKQEGLQQGLLEGEALLFKRLLAKRFGILPDWVQSKLQLAQCEHLEQWADNLLEATSLEAVFGLADSTH
jgi:predicted transposase YdaD